MKNKSVLLLFFISQIITNCTYNLKKIKRMYKDGSREEYAIDKDSLIQGKMIGYYPNNSLDYIALYKNGKKIDSTIYYYKSTDKKVKLIKHWKSDKEIYYKAFYTNGSLSEEGLAERNSLLRKGIWKFYNDNGTLNYTKEFKKIRGKSYTNQLWVMLQTGDTINEGTNMKYKVHPRKLKLGDSIRFFFQSDVSQYRNKSDFFVEIPKDYTKENFDPEFYNQQGLTQKGIPTQRILSLKYNTKYRTEKTKIDTADHKKTVVFYLKPKRIGNDTIRGYFNEVVNMTPGQHNLEEYIDKTKNNMMTTETRTIYFDIPIQVTPR
ncbi:toxin-antitoxin system YwqK family antitoxin [Aquimarina longa]|uniref:toxin-antitoxin system YwqK family antitoxin n=1 Tax=Aquimarina longa TaxID=1080221 RepID=UPI000A686E0F|nr:hypothetical protein [Aquimarina longa]